jgi:hypothetical protein
MTKEEMISHLNAITPELAEAIVADSSATEEIRAALYAAMETIAPILERRIDARAKMDVLGCQHKLVLGGHAPDHIGLPDLAQFRTNHQLIAGEFRRALMGLID